MTTLHLGVMDVPYQPAPTPEERRMLRWRRQRRPWQRLAGTTTTGDVAEILERRYRVMETFWRENQDRIVEAVELVMRGKLDNLMMGKPVDVDAPLFADNELSVVDEMFREFLDRRGMDGKVPGVPTGAAKRGVNHRLRHPYAKSNPARPSFIDRGEYQATFRTWVE